MGKIIVSENVSIDGVFQDPTGEEGVGRGDWRARLTSADRAAWAETLSSETQAAEALLLGRRSYQFFAARYPYRTGEWADKMNSLPKYVVSATLRQPEWSNSTILTGDVIAEVSALKHKVTGGILVYASSRVVATLTEHDLVDELRLMVYPLVVGVGERLFATTCHPKPMRLLGTRTIGDNLTLLTYQPLRAT